MSDWARRVGLNALATLPVWLAAGAVLLLARDLSEMASAAIAGAMLISLAGVVAIAVVLRRAHDAAVQHETLVQQSLALVECMKEINRRVMLIEAAAPVVVPAAVEMLADMDIPVPGNDRMQPETDQEPVCLAAPPPPLWDELVVFGEGQARIVTPADGSEEALAAALLAMRSGPGDRTYPAELRLVPAASGADLAGMLHHIAASETLPDGLLVGVDERALLNAGADAARAIATLAQRGARLSLGNAPDRLVDPEILASSNVGRIHISGGWFLLEMARNPVATMRWQARLAAAGVSLVATRIETDGVARALAALSVTLATGAGARAFAASPPGRLAPRPEISQKFRLTAGD